MSLRAVGWLSTVLGLNIDGRADGDEGEHRAPSASPAGPAGPAAPAGVDAYLHRLNDALFGGDGAPPAGGPAGGAGGAEDVALDASGLPVTTNWYYYDKDLGRWNVSPDAPAAIQEEYQRRLREEAEAEAEGERSGRQNAPPPPPPPPPPGAQPVQQGLWSTQAHTQSSKQSTFPQRQGGPQYAVPMYFNTTTPMQTGQVPQAPQQAQHHVLQSDQQAVLPQVPYNPQEQYAYQQQPQHNQHITQDQQYHQQHYQLRSGPGPQSQAIHSLPMSPGYRDEAHSSGY